MVTCARRQFSRCGRFLVTVTITAGSTSATFPITTVEVGSQVVINISAAYNCGFAFGALTINPTAGATGANISAFLLNPINVNGGSTSRGTIVLDSAARSGGAKVTLASGDTSVRSLPSFARSDRALDVARRFAA